MPAPLSIIGHRFAKVTVLREVDQYVSPGGRPMRKYLVRCDCGIDKEILGSHLPKIVSCGCHKNGLLGGLNRTHGEANKTAEYVVWRGMVQRCTYEKHRYFKNYGGRGIKVCDQWLRSFPTFLKDMGRRPSPKHSIDRYPDNDGNYEPSNCRWATRKQQQANRASAK